MDELEAFVVASGISEGARDLSISVSHIIQLEIDSVIYPFGCCSTDTINSTAVLLAIEAIPGLVTVHI